MSGPYVYIQSETELETGSHPLYTVGFYMPNGQWRPESDHGGEDGREKAAARVAWLNGSAEARIAELERKFESELEEFRDMRDAPEWNTLKGACDDLDDLRREVADLREQLSKV